MKIRTEYTCPLELAHDITKGKWKPIILWQLGKGAASLSQLKRDIEGISQKMLLEHLKELQQYHLVEKKEFIGYPLRVEYSLAPRGEKMLQAVSILQEIGIELFLEDGREDFLKQLGLL